MSQGAIAQLVANISDNAMTIITHTLNSPTPVKFNQEAHRFIIARECDIIKTIFFTFKMAPLPAGWIYKKCWIKHAFEHLELGIGGRRVIYQTDQHSRLSELIFPPKSHASRDMSFDYTVEERRRKSLRMHEIIYEFDIKDVFGDMGISLIALSFAEVAVFFRLGSLLDCLERDPAVEALHFLPAGFNPIMEFLPQSVGLCLDHNSRDLVAQRSHHQNSIIYSLSNIKTTERSEQQSFCIRHTGICSASYIHITNEDGSEIDEQVLSKIEIGLSGITIFSLTGFQSRHQVRGWLPHLTQDNILSQNLYYISYHASPYLRSAAGADQGESGINLTRIDRHQLSFIFDWSVYVPPHIKITIMHRMQNMFAVQRGIGGYREEVSIPVIIQEGTSRLTRQPIHSTVVAHSIFRGSKTPVYFSDAEGMCVITMEPIAKDTDVVQCQQCMQLAALEAMKEWFSRSKTCPCCRAKYPEVQFLAGKAIKRDIYK